MFLGCLVAVVLRYLLFFAGLSAYLEEHYELNTPMTSFTRLREGLFLAEAGASPYAGGACHYPPVLLLMLSWLSWATPLARFSLLVALDVIAALLLQRFATQYAAARLIAGSDWVEANRPNLKPPDEDDKEAEEEASVGLEALVSPGFVGLTYLFNPFVVASCLAHSFQNIQHVVFLASVVLSGKGSGGSSAVMVACALYVCPLTPVQLILPCAFLSFVVQRNGTFSTCTQLRRSKENPVFMPGFLSYLFRYTFAVLALFVCLLVVSAAIMRGNLDFVQASFIANIAVRDLSPNVGICWYLFVEVFDRYRLLFILCFHAQALMYPIPLHVRIGRHVPVGPYLHCSVAICIICMFQPYPTASDYGLMLSTLLVSAELISGHCKKNFAFLLSGSIFGLCMFPTMVTVWLSRNAGNANFVFNMNLVINVFSGLVLTEFIRAAVYMRHRQRLSAYCQNIVLGLVEKAVEGMSAEGKSFDEEVK